MFRFHNCGHPNLRTVHINIPCEECGMILENPVKLNKHKDIRHNLKKMMDQKVKKKCEICGKMIQSVVMRRHIYNMHGNRAEKPFKCDYENCLFSTLQKYNLELHKRGHYR